MESRESGKRKGWFSRRYQTAAAHLKAKEQKLSKVAQQYAAIDQRELERNKRTPQQQIKLLDERLGKDIGASRERKRLAREISQLDKPKKAKEKPDGTEQKQHGKSTKKGGRR